MMTEGAGKGTMFCGTPSGELLQAGRSAGRQA
jgi:hypothetical protein